jgi:hypothetical protein
MTDDIMSKPTQYASGYTLDLYCDKFDTRNNAHSWNEFPHQFTGETFAGCVRDAKKRGWLVFTKTRTARCPRCARLEARK